jgi:hypothetical protein
VSLIKIDVEGFELPVLDGAQETIRANRPLLIVEIMGGHHYEHVEPKVQLQIDITKWEIESMGYRVERAGNHDYLGIPEG